MSTISKPNTFSANTSISSSQMNANFDTIYNDYNGGISSANLATDSVVTAKIADSNVTTAKIADSNVTTAKVATSAITPQKWANIYKFRAYRTAALNTPTSFATAIVFDTESFDTNSNFNTGTGEYTAGVAGFHRFGWRAKITTSGTEQFQSQLYVNGAAVSSGTNSTAPSQHITTQGCVLIQLAANDVVTLRVSNTAARAFEVGSANFYFDGILETIT